MWIERTITITITGINNGNRNKNENDSDNDIIYNLFYNSRHYCQQAFHIFNIQKQKQKKKQKLKK